MIRMILALAIAAGLAGCSLTADERQAIVGGGLAVTVEAVESLRTIGDDPFGASPQALTVAATVCKLLDVGAPIIAEAINVAVARRNAEAGEDDQVEPVTLDEFRAALTGACDVVRALLEPSPPGESPVPEVRPEAEA